MQHKGGAMGYELPRRLALLAGNGAIFLLMAQTALERHAEAQAGVSAAVSLAGVALAYVSLVRFPAPVPLVCEALSIVAFLFMPSAWIYLGMTYVLSPP